MVHRKSPLRFLGPAFLLRYAERIYSPPRLVKHNGIYSISDDGINACANSEGMHGPIFSVERMLVCTC
jgi:hypothetical protein